jgi:geranylgeranylglycerol-phosphate geranylgeranyltransferase
MMKNRIRGFIDLIRPFTLLPPLFISMCIIAASYFYNDISANLYLMFFSLILPASLSLALINGASNILNQITDINSDKISKPYRPIPKGLISKKEAVITTFVLYSLAITLAFIINIQFLLITSIILFFTVTYSIPPRFKKRLFINQFWIAIPRGLLGILASWSVFGNPLNALPLTIGLIAMFYLLGGSITKDITDSVADKITGTKTLVNTYGVKKAALIVMPIMFTPFLMIPLLIKTGVLPVSFIGLTFFAIPSVIICYLMIKNDVRKIGKLENTTSWALMYVTYLFFAVSISTLIIIDSTLFQI